MSEQEKILNSGLLEQYVLGLLEQNETEKVETYLKNYPELVQHVRSLETAMEAVLMENAIEPPPSLRSEVLNQINDASPNTSTQALPPQRRSFSALAILLGLTTTAASFLAYLFYSGNLDFQQELEQSHSAYASLEKECADAKREFDIYRNSYAFLKSEDTESIYLEGTSLSPNSSAVIYWNETEKKGVLSVLSLPEPPTGKAYQLWADVEGKMVNMGTFDSQNHEFQTLGYIAHAESLNVTLEDIGQNKEATVDQLYISGGRL